MASIFHLNWSNNKDIFRWALKKNGLFSVKSMCQALSNHKACLLTNVWKIKLPHKIIVFLGVHLKRLCARLEGCILHLQDQKAHLDPSNDE